MGQIIISDDLPLRRNFQEGRLIHAPMLLASKIPEARLRLRQIL